jgi:hypothetical protein
MTMNDLEKNQERRKQKALERLGTNNPVCVLCGESDWRCQELHHIASKQFDAALAIVCRNCHRKLSDMQRDHPQQSSTPPDPLECIGHVLLGLADLFAILVEKLREFGKDLISRAAQNTATAMVSP